MTDTRIKSFKKTGTPWAEEELRAAVEAYLFLLQLQRLDISYSEKDFYSVMTSSFLPTRNEASVRYRFRNISFVFQEMGLPILKRFSAASQVGKNVQKILKKIILEYDRDTLHPQNETPTTNPMETSEVIDTLKVSLFELDDALAHLAEELKQFGHNNPPDEDNPILQLKRHIHETQENIASIRLEVEKPAPSVSELEEKKSRLLSLALGLAKWTGGRFTKFIDTALIALAPVAVAKLTGLMPVLMKTVNELQRYVSLLSGGG